MSASEQKLPFNPEAGVSESAGPVVLPESKLGSGLPFGTHQRILPSGTLLTVQLEDSLAAEKVHAGDAFTASVAAPLRLDGETVIAADTAVVGRIESAHSKPDPPGPGSAYFRLTLSAITVEGRRVALQTSSLFAPATVRQGNNSSSGSSTNPQSGGERVQKGRLLTFRLTAPVTLGDSSSVDNRQSPKPATE